MVILPIYARMGLPESEVAVKNILSPLLLNPEGSKKEERYEKIYGCETIFTAKSPTKPTIIRITATFRSLGLLMVSSFTFWLSHQLFSAPLSSNK
jgi:hypothetical protein